MYLNRFGPVVGGAFGSLSRGAAPSFASGIDGTIGKRTLVVNRKPNKDWKKKQSESVLHRKTEGVPARFEEYDLQFERATTFEDQMQALASRGFRRPYRPYDPPEDVQSRFLIVCDRVLTEDDGWPKGASDRGGEDRLPDMAKVRLSRDTKSRLLTELAAEFDGHSVPNSLLHTMTSLDKVLDFFKVPVSKATPYDLLAQKQRQDVRGNDELPANLHIQLEPIRFDPERAKAEGNLQRVATVTAFPRSSTILVTPESRKRFRATKPSKLGPWSNSPVPEDR